MRVEIGAMLVIAALGLGSCANQGGGAAGGNQVIRPTAQAETQRLSAPRVVYVEDFSINPAIVQTASDIPSQVMAARSGGVLARVRERTGILRPTDSTNPQAEARQAVNQLADSIVSGLSRAGIAAQRIGAGAPVPPDSWVLRGEFDRLSEGSRTQQALVGFGAGSPEIEVSGNIDAAQGTILTFGDENRTRRMPGGAVSRNPYVMAAKFVMSRGATGRDIQQLGSSLASEIVGYMRSNGLAR
jgi:hypothetical protein